jgi:hypothetical protein
MAADTATYEALRHEGTPRVKSFSAEGYRLPSGEAGAGYASHKVRACGSGITATVAEPKIASA